MDPTLAALYVNRAMCHKKRGAWERVIDDAQSALKLDRASMKVIWRSCDP